MNVGRGRDDVLCGQSPFLGKGPERHAAKRNTDGDSDAQAPPYPLTGTINVPECVSWVAALLKEGGHLGLPTVEMRSCSTISSTGVSLIGPGD